MKIAYIGPMTLKEFQHLFQEQLPEVTSSAVFVPMMFELLKLGHQVVICTESTELNTPFYAKSGQMEIFVAPVCKYGKIRAFTKWKRSIYHMAKFLKASDCDIYHAHWTYQFALAALKANTKRTVVTIRDIPELIYQFFNDYYRKRLLQMALEVFKKGKMFTANSQYTLEAIKGYHPDINVAVVPNIASEAKAYHLQRNKNVMVSVNNGFETRKNVMSLMQAFQIVRKEKPELTLKLYGHEYEQGGKAFQWAAERDLLQGIEFYGHQEYDVICQAMASSGMLAHPSIEETFGMTLVEAMSYGAVVVAGENSGAVPWVLDGGKAGALVDVTNPDALAQTILSLYQSQAQWDAYIEAGYKRVKDFSVEDITQKFLEIYQMVIESDHEMD